MVHIAVCDDDQKSLKKIETLLNDYLYKRHEKPLSVQYFSSPYDLVEYIGSHEGFQVYLLDIIMPDINGIEIGEIIRRKDQSAFLVYMTASKDYAIDSFSVHAFAYLVKPFDAERLYGVLDDVLGRLETRRASCVPVKTQEGIEILPLKKIMYAEYRSHHIYYFLSDEREIRSITTREPFTQITRVLFQDEHFIKISASYAVNMEYVKRITKKGLLMENGKELPISRAVFKDTKNRLIDFLLNGADKQN